MDTVGRKERAIKEYIKNQREEDYTKAQMTKKEYIDPFTGSKNKQAKKNSRLSGCPKLKCGVKLPCSFRD